jgi:hypothetical protein
MNCERARVLLDDFIDGTLERPLVERLERHLRDCPGCAREEQALRQVVSATSALPDSIEPARDLWPAIEAGLEDRRSEGLPVRTTFGWWRGLAAASLLLAMLGAGYLLRGYIDAAPPPDRAGNRAAVEPVAERPATPTMPAIAEETGHGNALSEIQQAELAFVEARRHLRAALAERRPTLSPETARTIYANLEIMEAAIEEIRASLARDPGNRELGKMLVAAQRREVEFLQRVTQRAARL